MKKIRLAIIGDSHVSCLKEASSQQSRDDINFDFFAVRGKRIRDTKLCKKKIIALSDHVKNSFSFTSAGKTEVKLDNYDAILLYASDLLAPKFLAKSHFSEAVIERAVLIAITNSNVSHLYESLKKEGGTKVYVMATPFRSIVNDNKSDMYQSHSLTSREFYRVFKEQYGFEFVSQPELTVLNDSYTKLEFSRGSTRLSVGARNDGELHPEDDVWHKNSEYGNLVLEKVVNIIS